MTLFLYWQQCCSEPRFNLGYRYPVGVMDVGFHSARASSVILSQASLVFLLENRVTTYKKAPKLSLKFFHPVDL